MIPRPRPAVSDTPFDRHGAITPAELERLGLSAANLIDFSLSVNPYGPAPAVRDALARIPLERYPDPDALALRRALAAHVQRPIQQIITGNGSAELLWLIALAFVQPGDRAMIIGPTFGEYARAARLMNAEILMWRATPEEDFAFRPDAIARSLDRTRPKIVFLCHPNNPTGQLAPLDALARWAAAHPAALFVVDEAYLPFAPGAPSALTLPAPNILVLRSMTKAQALAGLRLGYAVGDAAVIRALRKVQPPWSVNALAQAAGVAALAAQAHLEETLAKLAADKTALIAALQTAGWWPVPSATHFFLLPVADAAACRSGLLRQGVVVRDCASFGLPRHIRISTRTPEENAQVLQALAQIQNPNSQIRNSNSPP